jgi:serine/threonine-protein kinase
MGVSGAGKSTLGAAVAAELGWPFFDGDDFHPPENVAKMAASIPLVDADRRPWLARLHDLIAGHLARGEPAVVACSALKKTYREQLRAGNDGLVFVYLRGDYERLSRRLAGRRDHYMPAGLLESQFADLEEPGPDEAIVVDMDATVGVVVAALGSGGTEEKRSGGAEVSRLMDVDEINEDIEGYLDRWGRIFRVFRRQDSGCVSCGVWVDGRRWFVKHSNEVRGMTGLRRARHLHGTVSHPALARLYNSFRTPDGLALVYEWLPGQVLYDYPAGQGNRDDPAGAHTRFRSLPVEQILAALDTIYEVHLLLAQKGFLAVDFYDGCIIYDFDRERTYLCDLDEFRPGPFILEAERLPGSRRFMAPEEWRQGATIDQVTNVYALGRTAVVLLGSGQLAGPTWPGSPALQAVVGRATSAERTARQQSVREFVAEWSAAREQGS